jgi:hypothetical protein
MVKRAVQYGLNHRTRPPVRIIGIDEVSRRKGQVYLTVLYDLERRVLLCRHTLRVVCMDMWAAYAKLVKQHARPNRKSCSTGSTSLNTLRCRASVVQSEEREFGSARYNLPTREDASGRFAPHGILLPVREWKHDPRTNGQVALGGPILQDASARRTVL